VLIDAVIDTPAMRERFPEASNDFFMRPSAIADELWHLNRQHRSAWSLLTELRPFEKSGESSEPMFGGEGSVNARLAWDMRSTDGRQAVIISRRV
jgi:hypothetical protein